MTNEELNTALYRKMFDEQERFKEELRNASPHEIMLNAYEFVIREDILLYLEENDLSDRQARALLKSEHPLSDLFNAWENRESKHMEEIGETVEGHADKLISEARTKAKANRDARQVICHLGDAGTNRKRKADGPAHLPSNL